MCELTAQKQSVKFANTKQQAASNRQRFLGRNYIVCQHKSVLVRHVGEPESDCEDTQRSGYEASG